MIRVSTFLTAAFCFLAFAGTLNAQQQPPWEIYPLGQSGKVIYDLQTGRAIATNGVVVRYFRGVMTADRISVDQQTGDAIADGTVRIQEAAQVWAGEHFHVNFYTGNLATEDFRMGQPPTFAAGKGLHGEDRAGFNQPPYSRDISNRVFIATNALVTADDIAKPLLKVHASRIRIYPGDYMEAYNAVLYIGQVPVFYWPYYKRSLKKDANTLTLMPGYRSKYGAFVLGTYTWYLTDQIEGALHADYRSKRGPGAGVDAKANLGRWGEATLKSYYTHDDNPNITASIATNRADRQRLDFSYKVNLATNLYVKSVVRYQSDPDVLRDFFEGDYRQNPQPSTFVEANQAWSNFSLDAYVQPRVNTYLETVERLPDIRLTGERQQILRSPFYYESETSAGYYRRAFPYTNGITATPAYSAGRVDTYHQILLPLTLFGWLNITPRAGGRYTYYTETDGLGATNEETSREVFNTGAEVSFKASRTWPGIQNHFFDIDGVRHIVVPSINYAFVPKPSATPSQLPQFDSDLPSFRVLPIEYTDYNAIDAIDSQNVLRFGLQNKIQTKRNGQVSDVINWNLYTDWRLRPRTNQTTFADLYSDLVLKPRSWLTIGSITRYDIYDRQWRMSLTSLGIQPTDKWRWTISHLYLRDDFNSGATSLGYGNNIVISDTMYRVTENWGLGASHYFDALTGKLQEQRYSIYRDLRSWTAALTFQLRDASSGAEDFTVAFTFSLKAFPKAERGYEAGGGAYWLSSGY
jgi:LPS-assembly protein